ncbi:uncharacterized protein METZ01_LOCUS306092 [marine metagenome]|uniref:Uncharacterized protein n=1 Tax=marine metagenome TaxID=408172 RepID=A0A382MY46_9ZZZZ
MIHEMFEMCSTSEVNPTVYINNEKITTETAILK